ncbi:MAG: tryptophan--tRNA ligase [Bacteroidales bacterium]|nr:tryptophan--tRNA ligase [Bacteroidales bacterium]
MEVVVSGIRPTGNLHIGNYFGAIQNFIELQNNHLCYFFIADIHSLTTHPDGKHLKECTLNIVAEFIACGLNPEKAIIYRQSDIKEIPELYLYLNMFAYLGELERCTTFKEKARNQPNNVNAGLLTYPVLMAADILIHKATKVPVGKDQEQHLEMARNFASRFNRTFNVEYFPLPQVFNFNKELVKIPGLNGTGKMGKSEGNAIYLIDDDEIIMKKVMKAVTDAGPTQINQPMSEPIKNLFTLFKYFSTPEQYNYFVEKYNNCTIRYSELKHTLSQNIINFIRPIREKIKEIRKNETYLFNVLKEGAEKARLSASKTISEVKSIIGL